MVKLHPEDQWAGSQEDQQEKLLQGKTGRDPSKRTNGKTSPRGPMVKLLQQEKQVKLHPEDQQEKPLLEDQQEKPLQEDQQEKLLQGKTPRGPIKPLPEKNR